MNKKIIFIVLIVIVTILGLSFFVISQMNKNQNNPNDNQNNTLFLPTKVPNTNTSPEPTIFQDTQEYKDIQEKVALTEAPIHDRAEKVGKLLEKVPYQGSNFTFDFDNSTYSFKVTIPSDKQTEGNQEFDEFLTANGIEDRSWIQDLVVEYK